MDLKIDLDIFPKSVNSDKIEILIIPSFTIMIFLINLHYDIMTYKVHIQHFLSKNLDFLDHRF